MIAFSAASRRHQLAGARRRRHLATPRCCRKLLHGQRCRCVSRLHASTRPLGHTRPSEARALDLPSPLAIPRCTLESQAATSGQVRWAACALSHRTTSVVRIGWNPFRGEKVIEQLIDLLLQGQGSLIWSTSSQKRDSIDIKKMAGWRARQESTWSSDRSPACALQIVVERALFG